MRFELYRVLMASGEEHVSADPKPEWMNGTWIGRQNPKLRELMDAQGFAEISDIPVRADYRSGICERCGALGTERNHTAPRKIFGDDCETWPIVDLCVHCHREWHQRIEEYYR